MSTHLLFHVEFAESPGAARYAKIVDFTPRTGDFVLICDGTVTIRPRADVIEWSPRKQYDTPSQCLAVLHADHPLNAREIQAVEADGWVRSL